MAECRECGTQTVPGEAFCSNCGTKNPAAPKVSTEETTLDMDAEDSAAAAPAKMPETVKEAAKETPVAEASVEDTGSDLVSSASLGGKSTGDVPVPVKHTIKKGNTGGRQPAVKQLDPGSVLNTRYEIVRRIGGGGMGAVYLAKDRNLGDAPRAVKEMVEAHLDPAQHEKAIGDFKRESLLLTSLEHPSIPTIYDYFYDESLGRFYLVMKFISGGDLSSRLRSAPGGRIDERPVSDWCMQGADGLE